MNYSGGKKSLTWQVCKNILRYFFKDACKKDMQRYFFNMLDALRNFSFLLEMNGLNVRRGKVNL